jgi:hypothetical protein
MISIRLVLLILALVCFVCAAFGVNARGVNLLAMGLALWMLSLLVT